MKVVTRGSVNKSQLTRVRATPLDNVVGIQQNRASPVRNIPNYKMLREEAIRREKIRKIQDGSLCFWL